MYKKVKFSFLIILDTLLLLSNFFLKIDSIGEREKEVEFSLLIHFMTSEKNDWLQWQLWKVSIIESFISQYRHFYTKKKIIPV